MTASSHRRSDEELVALYRRTEDTEVLAVLFERYTQRVAAWCLRLSGSYQEAEDLAQEVFVRVHERLESFRAESRFSTWLYTVTRSVVINRGVYENRRRMDSLSDEAAPAPVSPEPHLDQVITERERDASIRSAFGELPSTEQQVLYLHYVDGLSLPAITRLMSLTNRSGAKKYIVNGKRHLKRILSDRGAAGERA